MKLPECVLIFGGAAVSIAAALWLIIHRPWWFFTC